jgi:3-isopropylmalate/(R)-2-methylmalate dehydratase large subunit
MGKTIIEKIISSHAGKSVVVGDVIDMNIDTRIARDFGGANVVKNLRQAGLSIDDPARTFFTFDCNPGGSSQKYAVNQHICRIFAREKGIKIYDIEAGIGTHIAIDEGLVIPGETLVSTDSHANLVGAIGAFGQGMGDLDIAQAFAEGKVWFVVPPTVKIFLKGHPPSAASLSGRITIASMTTEMGGICSFFPPSPEVIDYCARAAKRSVDPVYADPDAVYTHSIDISVEKVTPMISLPGHPEEAVPVEKVKGKKIDSVFIGSCTNGRYEDLQSASWVLEQKKVAPGVVLKIVPSTDRIWQQALKEGLIARFKEAGALVGNAGCAGCAEGQIGQNGPEEITVSTGNRNFTGKQGQGEVYLASPATAAASAVAGHITSSDAIPTQPSLFLFPPQKTELKPDKPVSSAQKPTHIRGKVWIIDQDNIDTDMIYHNRYLTITALSEMGRHIFSNLEGWEEFPQKAGPGDVVVIDGENFGCGSSRQQAVDGFKALGINLIIAKSFGSIYERNAINSGFPILKASNIDRLSLKNGDTIEADFISGRIINLTADKKIKGVPFSSIQLDIYQREGLLK